MLINEYSYGVIPVFRGGVDKFLILKQKRSWSFPKGHQEGDESVEETVRRELKEETQIEDIEFLDIPRIFESYILDHNPNIFKTNEYFIGIVHNQNVSIQENEIYGYKWVIYEEAIKIFDDEPVYRSRKDVLNKAVELLAEYDNRK